MIVYDETDRVYDETDRVYNRLSSAIASRTPFLPDYRIQYTLGCSSIFQIILVVYTTKQKTSNAPSLVKVF